MKKTAVKNFKKLVFTSFVALISSQAFAVSFESKSNITVGITPIEVDENDSKQFGGAYVLGDFALSNEKITAAGKIYYRLNSSNGFESNAQKIDIKRAYVRYRPFASNLLEFSLGKFYSYYLPGNFFSLSESYTGATRWGKTGAGIKSEVGGFTFGLGLPLEESYVKFADKFDLNAAVVYDFSNLSESIPVKLGGSLLFSRTGIDYSAKDSIKDEAEFKFARSVTVYYTPKIEGFFSKSTLALTYSYDAEPYVSSSVFKNVANYSNTDMKKSQFASLNFKGEFGPVQLVLEGEAGHSISGSMVPVYGGSQLLIPIYGKTLSFKPRFFYYAGIDTCDDSKTRQTFEFYPRLWITAGKYTVSLGFDFYRKELTRNDWEWSWSLPMYVQYKVGK